MPEMQACEITKLPMHDSPFHYLTQWTGFLWF